MDKPNGSHHERMEGLYGNLLSNQWPPQGRSDDNQGTSLQMRESNPHAIIQMK